MSKLKDKKNSEVRFRRAWIRFLHVNKKDGRLTVIRESQEPCCIFCKEDCEIVKVKIDEIL